MHIETALKYFLAAKKASKAPGTVRWYESKLSPLVAYLIANNLTQIEDVTIHHLNAWASDLVDQKQHTRNHPYKKPVDNPMSQNTRRGYVRAAKAWFKWCSKPSSKILRENPAVELEMPPLVKQPRTGISESDRDRLIEAARGNPRDYAILRFLAATGCRVGGVASLTMDRLHLNSRKAIVKEKGLGGQNKYRPVFFDEDTAYAIAAWLVARPDTTVTYVFIGYRRGGKHKKRAAWQSLSSRAIYNIIKRYAEPLGIKLWNPHNWRHGFARGATRRGIPLQTLTQLLGHSTVQVTADIYGTLDEDALQIMHETYNWLKKPVTFTHRSPSTI